MIDSSNRQLQTSVLIQFPSFSLQLDTNRDSLIFVHIQKPHSALPNFRDPEDFWPNNLKMLIPSVSPWIEKLNELAANGRNRRDVWPLLGVAVGAGKGQVRRVVAAAVLPRANMLDMKPEIRSSVLRQMAVFAPPLRSLVHKTPRACVHLQTPLTTKDSSSLALQQRNHVKCGPEFFQLCPLFLSQQSLVGSFCKLVQSRLRFRIRAALQSSAPRPA